MNQRLVLPVMCLILMAPLVAFAQRTDLSGLKICIDPGHGGHNPANDRHLVPDPGIDFWESESNFQKALLLKGLLEAKGATVLLTRTTNDYPNDDEPSLAARVAFANANAVDWFHSIHSNATGLPVNNSINYTLMLVREKRSLTDPAASTGPGLGVPQTQEAWDISAQFMSPNIKNYLRTNSYTTYLDWTFYGGANGGFSLGVLRGLLMPGELSEGSMHDFFPETRRLMNNDYRKMEAYALRNSFLQYLQVPADSLGIIAGIQKDIAGGNPINLSRVRLLPVDRVYSGDLFNNGFFMFDSLPPGSYLVRYETPGYRPDSVQVTVTPGGLLFADRALESFAAPTVVTSSPVEGDTAVSPKAVVDLYFSRVMDTASVRAGFSILPNVGGSLTWNPSNTMLRFTPSVPLPMPVDFVVTVDTASHSSGGPAIDGNGDGIPGDPYLLHFRTRVQDVFAPIVVTKYPDSATTVASSAHCVTITFDEPLNPATVTLANFAMQKIGGSLQGRTLAYAEANGKGAVNMYVTSGLTPGTSYRVRVSGVTDLGGNAIPTTAPILWDFTVAAGQRSISYLDSLNSGPLAWVQPGAATGTTGIDSATFSPVSTPAYPAVVSNPGAGALNFAWSGGASDWLLWLPPAGASYAKSVHWVKRGAVLQAFVFGDCGKSQIRFVVEDSVDAFPGGTPTNKEVGPWHTVDWVGWRLLEWDMENDSVGFWVGNRLLEGELRFDGIQMRYLPGVSTATGRIVLDQVQLAQAVVVSVNDPAQSVPLVYALHANYPNPFNPSTSIRYSLAQAGNVSLIVYDLLGREVSTLVQGHQPAGEFKVTWDARGVSSGVYLLRMSAVGDDGRTRFSAVTKMVLVR
ncbi:MAG: Ig-like domain-containing protein [Bacteroidota bacterium]